MYQKKKSKFRSTFFLEELRLFSIFGAFAPELHPYALLITPQIQNSIEI